MYAPISFLSFVIFNGCISPVRTSGVDDNIAKTLTRALSQAYKDSSRKGSNLFFDQENYDDFVFVNDKSTFQNGFFDLVFEVNGKAKNFLRKKTTPQGSTRFVLPYMKFDYAGELRLSFQCGLPGTLPSSNNNRWPCAKQRHCCFNFQCNAIDRSQSINKSIQMTNNQPYSDIQRTEAVNSALEQVQELLCGEQKKFRAAKETIEIAVNSMDEVQEWIANLL